MGADFAECDRGELVWGGEEGGDQGPFGSGGGGVSGGDGVGGRVMDGRVGVGDCL